jgi:hypothetical protein
MILMVFFSMNGIGEGSGDYPPPTQGDWIITSDTYVQNENITVTGNITIEDGGKFTLDNVTLIINTSDYGNSKISVKNGGELNIINNSKIMQGESLVNHDFIFENGSKGLIQNSMIRDCGWNDGGTWQSTGGILIMSDSVVVENSTIKNNYNGIVIAISSPVIRDNVIKDNLQYGIFLINGSAQIINNVISFNPLGVHSLFSDFWLINNSILDNGDGGRILYSTIFMDGGNISSNDRNDCSIGTCSSSESGKGMYIEDSEIFMSWVEISGNSDDGLVAYNSNFHVQNSTFSENLGNGITGYYSGANLTNNFFKGNSNYGIQWMYTPLEVDETNAFTQNNGMGRIILEWDVVVNVIDSYGDRVSQANIEFKGNGTSYTATSIMGVARMIISEYEIANDGSYIDHNPYTLIVRKMAPWDDIEYSNSTLIEIRENVEIDMIIPLKKPDLKVESITFPDKPKVENKVRIKVKISNIGDAAANNISVIVTQKDSLGKTSIVNKTTLSINSKDEKELSIAWIPEQEGETLIKAVVDNTKNIDEIDEENNEFEITVEVHEKDVAFYEEPYFLAGLTSLLIILAGASIYLLALRKKMDVE